MAGNAFSPVVSMWGGSSAERVSSDGDDSAPLQPDSNAR